MMYQPIREETVLTSGAVIRAPKLPGGYDFYTVGQFIPAYNGYELIHERIGPAQRSGILLHANKGHMISNGWEIRGS